MLTLGIDYGTDLVGVALVDEHNRVHQAFTLHLAGAVKGVRTAIQERRVSRHLRRSRLWYRRPKNPQRRKHAVTGAVYRRATGRNQLLHTTCKYVDPETGEVCGRNTPKLVNVKRLLLQDILDHVAPEAREGLGDKVLAYRRPDRQRELRKALLERFPRHRAAIDRHLEEEAEPLPPELEEAEAAIKTEISKEVRGFRRRFTKEVSDRYGVSAYTVRQLLDIAEADTGARAQFCSEHLPLHHTQTRISKQVAWLPPSIDYKFSLLMRQITKRITRADRVVIEIGRFDLQAIIEGRSLEAEEYQGGPRLGYLNTRNALFYEQLDLKSKGAKALCAYCGKAFGLSGMQVDHVDPRAGADRYNSWQNLVLACTACNDRKGKNQPEAVGMERPLKKALTHSRVFQKYTQSSQGFRALKDRLREAYGVEVLEAYGYETAFFRSAWFGPRDPKDEEIHAKDAVIVASQRLPLVEGKPDMQRVPVMPPALERVELKHKKGIRQRDTMPLELKDGVPHIHVMAKDLTLKQVRHVVDERARQAVLGLTGEYKGRRATVAELVETAPGNFALQKLGCDLTCLWFKRVKVRKPTIGARNLAKLGTGYFRIEKPNLYGLVYRKDGKVLGYNVKNPLYFDNAALGADEVLLKVHLAEVFAVGQGLRVVKFSKDDACVVEDLGTGKELPPWKLVKLWEAAQGARARVAQAGAS